jgi:hypothetical protein
MRKTRRPYFFQIGALLEGGQRDLERLGQLTPGRQGRRLTQRFIRGNVRLREAGNLGQLSLFQPLCFTQPSYPQSDWLVHISKISLIRIFC